MHTHFQKKLDAAEMDWSDFDWIKSNPDAIGHVRYLEGYAFSHDMIFPLGGKPHIAPCLSGMGSLF